MTWPPVQGDRGLIWLSDLVTASSTLQMDPTATAGAAALLGLRDLVGDVSAGPESGRSQPVVPNQRRPASMVTPSVASAPTDVEPLGSDDPTLDPPSVVSLREAQSNAPARLPSLLDVLPTPIQAGPLPPADLLQPQLQRAIVGAISSGWAQTEEIDVPACVERMARGESIDPTPMLMRRTTRRGLQLLVDIGEPMMLFSGDIAGIQSLITQLTGDGLEVLAFSGCPTGEQGAGSGPRWTWKPYRVPAVGRPVLVLSDLGQLAGPADRARLEESWCRLAARLAGAGIPVVALVPVPVQAVSRRLRRCLAVVAWDRSTGVKDAVQATRRAAPRVPAGR